MSITESYPTLPFEEVAYTATELENFSKEQLEQMATANKAELTALRTLLICFRTVSLALLGATVIFGVRSNANAFTRLAIATSIFGLLYAACSVRYTSTNILNNRCLLVLNKFNPESYQ